MVFGCSHLKINSDTILLCFFLTLLLQLQMSATTTTPTPTKRHYAMLNELRELLQQNAFYSNYAEGWSSKKPKFTMPRDVEEKKKIEASGTWFTDFAAKYKVEEYVCTETVELLFEHSDYNVDRLLFVLNLFYKKNPALFTAENLSIWWHGLKQTNGIDLPVTKWIVKNLPSVIKTPLNEDGLRTRYPLTIVCSDTSGAGRYELVDLLVEAYPRAALEAHRELVDNGYYCDAEDNAKCLHRVGRAFFEPIPWHFEFKTIARKEEKKEEEEEVKSEPL